MLKRHEIRLKPTTESGERELVAELGTTGWSGKIVSKSFVIMVYFCNTNIQDSGGLQTS